MEVIGLKYPGNFPASNTSIVTGCDFVTLDDDIFLEIFFRVRSEECEVRNGGRGAQNLEAPQYPFFIMFIVSSNRWQYLLLLIDSYFIANQLSSHYVMSK